LIFCIFSHDFISKTDNLPFLMLYLPFLMLYLLNLASFTVFSASFPVFNARKPLILYNFYSNRDAKTLHITIKLILSFQKRQLALLFFCIFILFKDDHLILNAHRYGTI
tara:strand:+ start:121 stop:447 length:327 start_codon:yes stop_codon:yes gene_type:complete